MKLPPTAPAKTPTERLRSVAERALPARPEIGQLVMDPSLRQAWRQLVLAARINEIALATVLAKTMGMDTMADGQESDVDAIALVPERLANEHLMLPIALVNGKLRVALANPYDEDGLRRLQFVADRNLELVLAPPERIEVSLMAAYARIAESKGRSIGTLRWNSQGEAVTVDASDDSAIVRLGRAMLVEALEARASDLHLQPHAGGGMARIRVDGILRRLAFLSGPVVDAVIRYFKAQCGMDPTNDRIPQDGRMSLVMGKRDVDLRLSVLPASRGERLVIRFLDQGRVYRLSGTGFSLASMQAMRRMAANTAGVLVITGPTGSGKTSTLYSLLAELNRPGVNIITVENPVEYRIAGISQVEVNTAAGLTFASALRSILRQDPDIVLIGEIRDAETAEIAMQAALTGHLVLTTLHTNDALTAVPRLLDLGVQPSVLADGLIGVVAQRLLRKLCMHCCAEVRPPYRPDEALFHSLTGEYPGRRVVGCEHCDGSGYGGRLPVAEIVEMTPELGAAVAKGQQDLAQLREPAAGPLSSMSVTAAARVVSGDTSAREAMRVIGRRFWTDLARHHQKPLAGAAMSTLEDDGKPSSGIDMLLFSTHPQELQLHAAALGEAGFQVLCAATPDQARVLLQQNEQVALIVADVDVHGDHEDSASAELLRQLRVALAWARLPALLLLPPDFAARSQLLDSPTVADHLVKPVSPEAVAARALAVMAR